MRVDNIHGIIDAKGVVELSQKDKAELSEQVAKIYHPRIKMFPKGTIEEALSGLGVYVRINEKQNKYPIYYIIGPVPIKGGYLILNCDKNEQGYSSKLTIEWE